MSRRTRSALAVLAAVAVVRTAHAAGVDTAFSPAGASPPSSSVIVVNDGGNPVLVACPDGTTNCFSGGSGGGGAAGSVTVNNDAGTAIPVYPMGITSAAKTLAVVNDSAYIPTGDASPYFVNYTNTGFTGSVTCVGSFDGITPQPGPFGPPLCEIFDPTMGPPNPSTPDIYSFTSSTGSGRLIVIGFYPGIPYRGVVLTAVSGGTSSVSLSEAATGAAGAMTLSSFGFLDSTTSLTSFGLNVITQYDDGTRTQTNPLQADTNANLLVVGSAYGDQNIGISNSSYPMTMDQGTNNLNVHMIGTSNTNGATQYIDTQQNTSPPSNVLNVGGIQLGAEGAQTEQPFYFGSQGNTYPANNMLPITMMDGNGLSIPLSGDVIGLPAALPQYGLAIGGVGGLAGTWNLLGIDIQNTTFTTSNMLPIAGEDGSGNAQPIGVSMYGSATPSFVLNAGGTNGNGDTVNFGIAAAYSPAPLNNILIAGGTDTGANMQPLSLGSSGDAINSTMKALFIAGEDSSNTLQPIPVAEDGAPASGSFLPMGGRDGSSLAQQLSVNGEGLSVWPYVLNVGGYDSNGLARSLGITFSGDVMPINLLAISGRDASGNAQPLGVGAVGSPVPNTSQVFSGEDANGNIAHYGVASIGVGFPGGNMFPMAGYDGSSNATPIGAAFFGQTFPSTGLSVGLKSSSLGEIGAMGGEVAGTTYNGTLLAIGGQTGTTGPMYPIPLSAGGAAVLTTSPAASITSTTMTNVGTCTSITASTAVISANASRHLLTIKADPANTINLRFVKANSTASSTSMPLAPGESYTEDLNALGYIYRGAIQIASQDGVTAALACILEE